MILSSGCLREDLEEGTGAEIRLTAGVDGQVVSKAPAEGIYPEDDEDLEISLFRWDEEDKDTSWPADDALSDAVEEAAGALAARTFEEVDAMDVKGLVAQKAGVVPLVCEVSSDAPYWGDSPLQYANRYQERAADLLDSLGDGAYKVAAARFVTQDQVKSVLFVVTAA